MLIVAIPAGKLAETIKSVVRRGLTGKLVINFSQGKPAHELVWSSSKHLPDTAKRSASDHMAV